MSATNIKDCQFLCEISSVCNVINFDVSSSRPCSIQTTPEAYDPTKLVPNNFVTSYRKDVGCTLSTESTSTVSTLSTATSSSLTTTTTTSSRKFFYKHMYVKICK